MKSHSLFLTIAMFVNFFGFQAYSAESYIVVESNSARILMSYNANKKRPVAGLVKIAAVKVALDWAKVSKTSLDTKIVIPQGVSQFLGPNPMGLRPGDSVSMRDILYSTMLGGDTVSMYALANHIGMQLLMRRGKRGDPQKVFVSEMNQLAKSLGMKHTKFVSVHGLDFTRKKGYSTASDIARLAIYVMRDEAFTFYVKQKKRKIEVMTTGGVEKYFIVKTTNRLLGQKKINGIKTGLSPRAGQCIALSSHHLPLVTKLGNGKSLVRKKDLIVVLLGSMDRFGQASRLVEQGWALFDQWGSTGYVASENMKDYLIVPQLR